MLEKWLRESCLEIAEEMGVDEAWEFLLSLPEEVPHVDECMAVAICKVYPELRQRLRELDDSEVGP